MDLDNFEQAASLSFFHLSNLSKTISILNQSQKENLKLVAVALSGYSPSSESWKSLSLKLELHNPSIRSIFTVLASNGDIQSVLNDKELLFKDRLGIALRYLEDQEVITVLFNSSIYICT